MLCQNTNAHACGREQENNALSLPHSDHHHLHLERLHDFIAITIRIATVFMFLPSQLRPLDARKVCSCGFGNSKAQARWSHTATANKVMDSSLLL